MNLIFYVRFDNLSFRTNDIFGYLYHSQEKSYHKMFDVFSLIEKCSMLV